MNWLLKYIAFYIKYLSSQSLLKKRLGSMLLFETWKVGQLQILYIQNVWQHSQSIFERISSLVKIMSSVSIVHPWIDV